MSTRDNYPTDLTDPQWQRLDPLLPQGQWVCGGRRPPTFGAWQTV